ncbi:MAG TPA: aspartate carbamoyltransferase [Burkholderiales bacterium]|jgi:hypothetical protein|nr:aspartate carbamoyltransferase [Burkholderiales bacterium]
MKPSKQFDFVLVVLLFALPNVLYASDPQREQEVVRRGSQIMPFDLDQTTHLFQPLKDGGVQRVVANDVNNKEQIGLIRAHLKEEAARFARGDFSAPAKIHGADMPGIAELSRGATRILESVRHVDLPNGAEIRYTTVDKALIDAIHLWFQAQLHDHGRHAVSPAN